MDGGTIVREKLAALKKKAGVRPLLLFSASPVKMREALKLCVWVSLLHRRKA